MQALSLRESLQDERTKDLLRRIRRGAATQMTQDDAARFWWLDAGVSDQVTARLINVAWIPGGGAPRATQR